jgi:Cyclic nucleotide-binding domain
MIANSIVTGNPLFLYCAMLCLAAAMLPAREWWIRNIALIAGLALMGAFAIPAINPIGLGLSIAFFAINLLQTIRLKQSDSHAWMNEDERFFFERGVPGLDPKLVRKLLSIGTWHDFEEGHMLMHQGQDLPFLQFVSRGAATVLDKERPVGVCGPGDFLGEMSLVSGGPASATVKITHPTRICAFDRGALAPLLEVNQGLSRNLTDKLDRMNRALV